MIWKHHYHCILYMQQSGFDCSNVLHEWLEYAVVWWSSLTINSHTGVGMLDISGNVRLGLMLSVCGEIGLIWSEQNGEWAIRGTRKRAQSLLIHQAESHSHAANTHTLMWQALNKCIIDALYKQCTCDANSHTITQN